MKVWVYVEGESDRLALRELWTSWRTRLGTAGWGIHLVPLANKAQYLRKVGPRAAEKLVADPSDIVVGLPDLYPHLPDASGPYKHDSLDDLRGLQTNLVEDALIQTQGISRAETQTCLDRFLATALKHDLEMLLLAAKDRLRAVLGTRDRLGKWRSPPEDQDQMNPPKKIVQGLFRTKSARHSSYKDTVHAPAVLRKVADLREVLFTDHGAENCPVFREMLDRVGNKTGIPAYE